MDTTAVYAGIVKHERNADGDLVVYGRATGPDLDLDQQIADRDWLKTAVPSWFSTGANVREQHQAIAAGVGTEIVEADDGGWDLKALVVDPVSAKKVEKGVLRGYSIGIRNPKVIKDATAPGGRIVSGSIVEISLVDRPCNETCKLTLAKAAKPGMTVLPGDLDAARMLVKTEEWCDTPDALLKVVDNPAAEVAKRQFTAAQREQAASSGAALPDGSFPIKTVQDLKNAIHAIGRAKDPEKAKAHIKARARALGTENLIPDSWKAVTADAAKAEPGMYTHDPAQLAEIRSGLVAVMKAELDELDGGEHELGDVSQLLRSLSLFLSWWDCESWQGETTSPYAGDDSDGGPLMAVTLSAEADATKNADPTTGPAAESADKSAAGKKPSKKDPDGNVNRGEDGMDADENEDGGPDDDDKKKKKSSKAADTDVASMVKDAVASALAPLLEALAPKTDPETSAADAEKATAADENTPDLTELVKATVAEATAPLKELVAKALAQPAPGGPVLTRTAEDTNKAAAREQTLAKAAEFERLALEVHDPITRQGYMQKAQALRNAA